MSLKSSGLWCDLCRKPILDDPYWNIGINGKPGHSCEKCKLEHEKPTKPQAGEGEE